MPRLATDLLRLARVQDPLLLHLLKACRTLPSAKNELRWLSEHVTETALLQGDSLSLQSHRQLLTSLCKKRGRGAPLQYLLGTEYFGELELRCRPGVLIPRAETALATAKLAEKLKGIPSSELSILDLCTGTGCIPLLLAHELQGTKGVNALGVDISPKAIALARHNHHISKPMLGPARVEFAVANVLEEVSHPLQPALWDLLENKSQVQWDVVTCNPPYISADAFDRTTARSVRNFEPKLALVPPVPSKAGVTDGDTFYAPVLRLATKVKAKVVMLEVADLDQACRVAGIALDQGHWDEVQIWRDDPYSQHQEEIEVNGKAVPTIGDGHGRTVVCSKG